MWCQRWRIWRTWRWQSGRFWDSNQRQVFCMSKARHSAQRNADALTTVPPLPQSGTKGDGKLHGDDKPTYWNKIRANLGFEPMLIRETTCYSQTWMNIIYTVGDVSYWLPDNYLQSGNSRKHLCCLVVNKFMILVFTWEFEELTYTQKTNIAILIASWPGSYVGNRTTVCAASET